MVDPFLPEGLYLTIEPRGLSLVQAAHYVGVGPLLFATLVDEGQMPRPKVVGPRKLWDRRQLDRAFDELPAKLDLPNYPPRAPGPATTNEKSRFPIHIAPPTKAEIAAVRLKMDMDRYGQSTEGMTESQIDKLEEEVHKRWVEKVRGSPLNKREKAALPRLYELRHQSVVRHGEIKGASWSTEDSLEARGYAVLNKHKDLTVSWRITEAGIKAVEEGLPDG